MPVGGQLTYASPGRTRPANDVWPTDGRTHTVDGFLRFSVRVSIGEGEACWAAASTDVLAWAVKTRSGFTVDPPGPVTVAGVTGSGQGSDRSA